MQPDTLDGVSATLVYLLYAEDGATLIYAGTDAEEYQRLCRELACRYAGSLVGRRMAGRAEQWEVRSFFRAQPSPRFIADRRRFPHSLTWEPAGSQAAGAADSG